MESSAAVGGGDDNRTPPEAPDSGGESAKKTKRKMKSPYQLQVLEETYAVDTYPSEAVRAEVSAKIGLSDRQLQMWFCHRRLKDRKFQPTKRARKEEEPPPAQHVGPSVEMTVAGSNSSSPFSGSGETRRAGGRAAVVLSRIRAEVGIGKRSYERSPMLALPPMPPPQLSIAELRAIASVEAQLGEPIREDGPILGVEFEPLPPGAFGAPIAITPHQNQLIRPYSSKMFDRHEMKAIKTSTFLPSMEHCYATSSSSRKRKPAFGGSHVVHCQTGSRALQEYQFLPEQPSIRSETYERLPQTHLSPNTRVSSLPTREKYLHGNEQVSPAYTFQGQLADTAVPSQQARQQVFSSGLAAYENSPHSNSLASSAIDAQFTMHQVLGSENPYSSDTGIFQDENPSRLEKKRKVQSDEARIQKEVEAHEKRIRKELEKQDILRRKREDHMRREMERHDRERKKEEERMLREKQREEEKLLREQRREIERREKSLQKETQRAEKMMQKEELRREKEAARLKAANERATARKIAKEYMELIEDERLELMELAAASKGLSSIITLDSETLQQLDMFRDMLSAFPPKSVQLKQPFATLPWTNSDENIANFLMVWKFLITFTDVLGLCSFTINEFLQSLHDYESKLLGQMHVSLLKYIIKDIEDVARVPVALGANQNYSANPGGGHPQIVEGAYAWGFDICSWQRHLNILTWPEILRQFALSAGFGPQMKKRNAECPYQRDDNEGNNGEDVISTLRNGVAAENAVALMHEKGYSQRRRSRHRLTPGTVKFAAFHVLSLEGSKGLTILEAADKIQKSGLRDLTTSKTPEASIAAALSRDAKLFERTAPSTYCVRSPFRKDPAEADAILSAAREKVQVFQNGLSDSDDGEKDVEDADFVERDEDSECDGADDPEGENASIGADLNKNVVSSRDFKDSKASTSLEDKKGVVLCDEVGATPRSSLINTDESPLANPSANSNLTSALGASQAIDISPNSQSTSNADVKDREIDECNFVESWVQGLTEGDYSDLTVEERLNTLVALIGVAIEGNSIRVILEERLEAANTLKKQMWAEAQQGKRRIKEEYMSKVHSSSVMGSKAEASQTNVTAEGSQAPLETINNQFLELQCQSSINNVSVDRNFSGQELSTNTNSVPLYQYGHADKPRPLLKSYVGHKAEQLYVYRSLPLGQDRRRNRYWLFSTSTSPNEAGSGRIFFESKDGLWRLIDTEEAFDALLAALDTRGIRESYLHSMLKRIEPTFKEAIIRNKKHGNPTNLDGCLVKTEIGASDMISSPDSRSEIDSPSGILYGLSSGSMERSAAFKIESGRNEKERNAASKRYKVFLRWMWKECYNPSVFCAMQFGKRKSSELLQICPLCYICYLTEERHCPSCHKTFKPIYNVDAQFSEHVTHCDMNHEIDPNSTYEVPDSLLPIGIQLLKAQLSMMEVSIPAEAFQPFWTEGYRKSWGVKLHSAISAEDLLQLVTLLEGAIKREFLSSNFETTSELLSSSTRGAVSESASVISGSIPDLPWVPATIAAVGLRLLDLDASLSYTLDQKLQFNKEKEARGFIKLPSRSSVDNNIQEIELTEASEQIDNQREARWFVPGSCRGRGRGTRGRGGRGHGRRGRGLRGTTSSMRSEYLEENIGSYQKATRKYTRRGGGRTRGRGQKRGRRSVRPRQRLEDRVAVPVEEEQLVGINQQSFEEESPISSGANEWGLEQRSTAYIDNDENSSQSESDGNGDQYVVSYGQKKPMGLLDDETDEDEEEEDGDGYEVEYDGAPPRVGHHDVMMDVDGGGGGDDDDDDIGDENGVDVGGNANGGDEEDYSSDYSSD